MALPTLVKKTLDNYGDVMEKTFRLAYLKKGESAKPLLEGYTSVKIYHDVTKRLFKSNDDKIEAARLETILNISKYVKDHPKASQAEIQRKVAEEINVFRLKIHGLV